MSGRFQPYPDYQDSGTCYLREVPSTWEIKQLKRSVEGCVNGVWGQEPTGDSDDIVVIRVADFDRPRLGVSDVKFTRRAIPEKDRVRRRLRRGDLLLEKSGGGENQQVGQVVLFDADIEAVTSNFVARLRPQDGIDAKYLNYAFSSLYRDRMNTCSIKQNTGIQNLDSNAYLAEQWAFPSPSEQQQIAAFLDYETAKIDALIEKQQQLIALLGEKRQAVISHAVTKGLNPDVPMRDSGIEWLGEVPEHWTVCKCGFYLSVLSGFAFPSSGFSDDENDTRLLRGINVSVSCIRWDETVRWKRRTGDRLDEYEMAVGDLVIGMDRPIISDGIRVSKIREEDVPSLLLQRVASIKPGPNLSSDFLMQIMSSPMFAAHIEPDTTGVSVPHISPSQIADFVIAMPPIEEQERIASVLDEKLSKFDLLMSSCEDAMELLQERRTALISAAVTGKIDVRGWKPPSSARMPETEMEVA